MPNFRLIDKGRTRKWKGIGKGNEKEKRKGGKERDGKG